MHTRWAGWALLAMAVKTHAFLSRPVLLGMCPRIPYRTSSRHGIGCSVVGTGMTQMARGDTGASRSIDLEDISGKRLYIEFAAFGFSKRDCQLELKEDGDCQLSKGMVAKTGAWRVEEEGGTEYLQFSSPLTELYSEIFFVPSGLLFWRVPLRKGDEGMLVLEDGQIISERKQLFGLRQFFVNEGTFKARVLADDEEFPIPDDIDISDVEVPNGLFPRKKRKGKGADETTSFIDQIAEPPLSAPEE